MFVVNGANLIDGFNGLLAVHFLLINCIFLLINIVNQNENLSIILSAQVIIVLSFLFFNFPKAKIFLGDSGSYLLGTLIVLNTIKTYELNPQISPFFFAGVLFYLFYVIDDPADVQSLQTLQSRDGNAKTAITRDQYRDNFLFIY